MPPFGGGFFLLVVGEGRDVVVPEHAVPERSRRVEGHTTSFAWTRLNNSLQNLLYLKEIEMNLLCAVARQRGYFTWRVLSRLRDINKMYR
jgi:hypothetical protein